MRNRFQDFMYGRYGSDQLNRFLSILALIVLVVGWFVPFSGITTLAAIALIIYTYYRSFSRDTSKRSLENEKYMNFIARFRRGGSGRNSYYGQDSSYYGSSRSSTGSSRSARARKEWEQRKDYKFFSCPHCNQRVRVPRGRGKICITCPKCHTEFVKRS